MEKIDDRKKFDQLTILIVNHMIALERCETKQADSVRVRPTTENNLEHI